VIEYLPRMCRVLGSFPTTRKNLCAITVHDGLLLSFKMYHKQAGECSSVAEYLPSIHKILNFSPSIEKKKRNQPQEYTDFLALKIKLLHMSS
jgi:hypothetical protein